MYTSILCTKDVDSVPAVIAGSNCELRDPNDSKQVSIAEARELARRWNVTYYGTSSKDKINNEECFYQVVREIGKSEAKKN